MNFNILFKKYSDEERIRIQFKCSLDNLLPTIFLAQLQRGPEIDEPVSGNTIILASVFAQFLVTQVFQPEISGRALSPSVWASVKTLPNPYTVRLDFQNLPFVNFLFLLFWLHRVFHICIHANKCCFLLQTRDKKLRQYFTHSLLLVS